ncbi:MAG: hypothetical protein ABIX46_12005 [Burkholderiaceae bacterium]
MFSEIVISLGIHDLGGALAGHPARSGTDGCTSGHADGPGHCAEGRTGDSTRTRAGTSADLVLLGCATFGGIGLLGDALAAESPDDAADDDAGNGADRTDHRAESRTGDGATRGTNAGTDRMRTRLIGDRIAVLGVFLGHVDTSLG